MREDGRSRSAALAGRLAELGKRGERLPGAPVVLEAIESERALGGGLIAGGVAFRMFLWLTPFGLVLAGVLSFWSDHDSRGLEAAARDFGVGAAAAQAATEALESGERNIAFAIGFGLVFLAWFTIGALRALILSYALAWHVSPPRIRRPFRAIATFNGLFLLAIVGSFGIAWLRERFGSSALLGIVVSLALTTAIAVLAMWLLPHRAVHRGELLPGALMVAAGHQLLQIAVVFYFAPKLGESEETYGAFGAAATMLVWLYVIARLITGAAFLNATLWSRRNPNGLDTIEPAAGRQPG